MWTPLTIYRDFMIYYLTQELHYVVDWSCYALKTQHP